MSISFLYPQFLWGLLLAVIPLIIHLFNFRKYTTVYFSDISLLKAIQQSSKAKKQVKNWLLLLLRMLVVAFLVLLFAQPIIPTDQKNNNSANTVVIFIDNSPSMGALLEKTTLFNQSKYIADQIISSYPKNTLFKVFDLNTIASAQFFSSESRAKELVANVDISRKCVNWEDIKLRILDEVEETTTSNIHWISDFNDAKSAEIWLDITSKQFFHGLSSDEPINFLLDSIYFAQPIRKINETEYLQGSLQLKGDVDSVAYQSSLVLSNGKEQLINGYIAPNKKEEFTINYLVPTSTTVSGEVKVEGDNYTGDNKLYFSYQKPEKIKVCLITNNDQIVKSLTKLYQSEPLISLSVQNPNTLNHDVLLNANLLILGELNNISSGLLQTIQAAQQNAIAIAVIPGDDIDFQNYNQLSSTLGNTFLWESKDTTKVELSDIMFDNWFFDGVFDDVPKADEKAYLPILKVHYQVKKLNQVTDFLIYKANKQPYFWQYNQAYYFSGGISSINSNMINNAIFVPVFLKIAFNSAISSTIYYNKTGVKTEYKKVNYDQLEVQKPNEEKFNWLPANTNYEITDNFNIPGIYKINYKDSIIGAIAFNYNPKEFRVVAPNLKTELSQQENSQWLEFSENQYLKSDITKLIVGVELWKYCLYLVIFLILMEMLVSSWWKV